MDSKKSSVWKFFEHGKEKDKTICVLCHATLSYKGGSTSGMWTHLSYKHPTVNPKGSRDTSSLFKSKQSTLQDFSERCTPMATAQQESITRKIAMMCAVDLKPLSLVEGEGFRAFCQSLNSRYKVPTRKTVSKYLESIYEDEKTKLMSKVKGLPVSLTSDLWTSTAMQGYITLTGHFLTSDWKLSSNVFATRVVEERHTGGNIAAEVQKITREFEMGELVALSTDNASNMGIACKELNVFQVTCFAHTLQLAISDGLKLTQISKTLGAARKLVSHFSHSLISTKALLDKQASPKLKLVQDVATRWNSSYFMMDRLLKLRIPVYGVIFDESVTKAADRIILDIRDSFWGVMEDVCPILEPLAELTELLGKEDTPTGSSVFVILHNLISDILKVSDGDSGVAKDLKQKIKAGLTKRFKIDDNGVPLDEVLTSPLMFAALLDPRYKTLISRDILSLTQTTNLHLEILDEMQKVLPQRQAEQPENVVPNKKKKLWNLLHGDSSQAPGICSASDELKHYLDESVTTTKPLEWWQLHEPKFPRLSKLAKKYLSVQATSVPSERTFSTAGLTVTKLRSNLDRDTVDQIIFINRNLKSGKVVENSNLRSTSDSGHGIAVQSETGDTGIDSIEPQPVKEEIVDMLDNAIATPLKTENIDDL